MLQHNHSMQLGGCAFLCSDEHAALTSAAPARRPAGGLQFYPTYLGMWQAVQSAVQRADLLKYFIMHAIGGAPLTAGRSSAGHPATPLLARFIAQNALPVA